ncbi:PASTA domain-containing protein [Micromonospora sp. WMMD812]|uniref:PASTA domain-containing protein n=1 Tax=Micromonospora sp. WMMD812 TaxID=3015152 RepID=UPI00248CA9B1|nr:PASTA domain-containing protein [Micromonospora sp. WMMD812]WBB65707.1 PASTA domain-containing protein [Micromonospora sp. WMMD812]
MSDDRQEPPAGEHDGDQTRPLPRSGEEPADHTQRLPGPANRPGSAQPAEEQPRPTPPDATAPLGRPADETAPLDRAAPTGRPADETAPLNRAGPDRTAPLPPERSAPWSGRAEVPPPRPADYREPAGEWYAEDQGGRRWWLPILWGILALLLVALLGTALWLVLSADDDRTGPEPTLSPSLTTAAATSAAPTSAAPTSESPSAPPTTEAGVPVPPLVGLSQATAEGLLDRLGLSYRVEYRTSELPPGRVIASEPEAGEPVPDGEEVVLVVSRAAEPTSSGPLTSSPTATGPTATATS